MARKYIDGPPRHCKATAERIRRDAEQIAVRLAKGEQGKTIAAEYDCNQVTLRKYLIAVISKERWRQLVYGRGPKPGHGARGTRQPKEAVPEEDGSHCFHCTMPITPDTRVCGFCGTLQQG